MREHFQTLADVHSKDRHSALLALLLGKMCIAKESYTLHNVMQTQLNSHIDISFLKYRKRRNFRGSLIFVGNFTHEN